MQLRYCGDTASFSYEEVRGKFWNVQYRYGTKNTCCCCQEDDLVPERRGERREERGERGEFRSKIPKGDELNQQHGEKDGRKRREKGGKERKKKTRKTTCP